MSGTQAAQHAYNERSHYGHITVTLFQTHISMPRGETTSDHQSDQQAHQYAHGEHLCMQYDRLTAILRWRRRYLSVTCAVGNLYFGSTIPLMLYLAAQHQNSTCKCKCKCATPKGDKPPTGALPVGEFRRPTSLHTRKVGKGENSALGEAGDRDVRGTGARRKVRRPRRGPKHGAWGGGGGLLM